VGDGTINRPATSCREIWNYYNANKMTLVNGLYYLYDTNYANTYQAYCDMTGGGFTLLMKLNGASQTFKYSSSYWTSRTLLPGNGDLSQNEVKLASYHTVPINELKFSMHAGGSTNSIIRPKTASSLSSVISSEEFSRFGDSLGTRTVWSSLVGSSSLQANCNSYVAFAQILTSDD
jgi:hypothetical protein